MHTTVYAAGFYEGQLKLNLILAKKCAERLSNCLDDLTADMDWTRSHASGSRRDKAIGKARRNARRSEHGVGTAF
jgi:hypothetical protein